MKKVALAIGATVLIFFVSLLLIEPIISNLGYSSVEASYHLGTHALIVSLIITVILCTLIIIERINEIKEMLVNNKKK